MNFFMEKVCVIFRISVSFCASWRHGCLSSPKKFICTPRVMVLKNGQFDKKEILDKYGGGGGGALNIFW